MITSKEIKNFYQGTECSRMKSFNEHVPFENFKDDVSFVPITLKRKVKRKMPLSNFNQGKLL